MTQFIIIRQEHLEAIPATVGRSLRQAAAVLLEYFKNQRRVWLTFNLPQLYDLLLGQWGRETIRKAAELLSEIGLVERRHHRINGRAWQYRLVEEKEVTVTQDDATVTPDEVTVTPDEVTSIYIDPYIDPISDPTTDPGPVVEEKIECQKEEFDQACAEIREIPCTPRIALNEVVRKEIKANWQNLNGAIAYLKHAVKTWDGRKAYNWTGVLITALRKGQTPPDFSREKEEIPAAPEGFLEWCDQEPGVKLAWYSRPLSEWVAIYDSGLQRPWFEAMGVEI